MSTIWIKICGITQPEHARAAAALAVDAIGLVFYAPSPRATNVVQAQSILQELPAATQVFALFVDPAPAEVEAVLAVSRIDHLQFHGNEDAVFCESFGLPYMKAIRVQDEDSALLEIAKYPSASTILLDSFDKDVPGGTGKTFDWSMASSIVRQCNKNIVLAGGLNAANVAAAVNTVRPFGVDVSSAVEAIRGVKDLKKMQLFVEGVRSVGI